MHSQPRTSPQLDRPGRQDQAIQNQTGQDQANSQLNRPGTRQAGTGSDQTGLDQVRPDRTRPDQASERTESGHTRSSHARQAVTRQAAYRTGTGHDLTGRVPDRTHRISPPAIEQARYQTGHAYRIRPYKTRQIRPGHWLCIRRDQQAGLRKFFRQT